MVYSPSPPILTLGKLWYDLQDVDPAIAFVSERLSTPDPDLSTRPEVAKRFQIIREKRKSLLGALLEKKRSMILEAMECERRRHAITMDEMRKLLRQAASEAGTRAPGACEVSTMPNLEGTPYDIDFMIALEQRKLDDDVIPFSKGDVQLLTQEPWTDSPIENSNLENNESL